MSDAGATPAARRQPGAGQRQFCADLRGWRERRGLSARELGERTVYSREFVTKVERGERWPTLDFARRADAVLDTGGVLLLRWPAVEAERNAAMPPARPLAPVLPLWPRPAATDPAAPVAGDALTALVAGVLREFPAARIVLAIESGAPAPGDARAVGGPRGGTGAALAAPDVAAEASSDGARVYFLAERRAR